jgi:hypothetical protein
MTIPRKNTLLCATLTIVLAALLIQGAAFAGGLTFGREKLKGTSKTQGDFSDPSQPPAGSIPHNIGLAQQRTADALGLVTSALTVDWSGKPHAVNAKALLEQANQELKLANTSTNTGK